MFPRRIGDNATKVTTVVRGPHPISLLVGSIIDGTILRPLATPRDIRWGEPSSIAFRGQGGIQQPWRGVQGAGAAFVRPGFNQALPNTSPSPGISNDILATMARNGMASS